MIKLYFIPFENHPKDIEDISKDSRDLRANVITQKSGATLDRTQISDRKAVEIITETLKNVQKDPSKFNYSRSFIRK